MRSRRNRAMIAAGLIAGNGILALRSTEVVRGDDTGDFTKKISKAMPSGWSATFKKPDGGAPGFIYIQTPKIKTGDSKWADDIDETGIEAFSVYIEVLPKHSQTQVSDMKTRNKTVYERLRKQLGPKRASQSQELVHVPQFYNSNYSYYVRHNRSFPREIEDKKKLREVIKTISADWNSYTSQEDDIASAILGIVK